MALALLALDYEHDALDTPRIAAAVPRRGDAGWLAIVRRDALVVKEVPLAAGAARYIATYEANDVRDSPSHGLRRRHGCGSRSVRHRPRRLRHLGESRDQRRCSSERGRFRPGSPHGRLAPPFDRVACVMATEVARLTPRKTRYRRKLMRRKSSAYL